AAGAVRGTALCSLYSKLHTSSEVLGVRSDGTGRAAVIAALTEASVPCAASEAAMALLRGAVVTVAAESQAAAELQSMVEGLPRELIQVVEPGSWSALPPTHTLRACGVQASALWCDSFPPKDFGGWVSGSAQTFATAHGMARSVDALTLARTNMETLAKLPRSIHHLTQEAADLSALLATSTPPSVEVPTVPGLPPPRWARSAYDRGMEEIHDALDLFWAFGELQDPPLLGPARKHFLLTTSSEISEEIVKAAILTALGPWKELITLHAIGLGSAGLSRDPLKGFCRLVESGRENLEWALHEHDSATEFLEWLGDGAPTREPAVFFGKLWGHEEELRRTVAASGGAIWSGLWAPEPFEWLRRWSLPVPDGAASCSRRDVTCARVEGLRYPPRDE
ncbi:unnamed protein product, partial [Symbiodinium natans]